MKNGIDTEYYAQHIQCTREAKAESLFLVRQLLDLAFAAKEYGVLKMDEMIQDKIRYSDPFLRKAVSLVIEVSDQGNIRDVLYNYIFTSGNQVNNHFFMNCMMITETLLAVSRSEDLDYIFMYLVPSFFGFEHEQEAINLYQDYRQKLWRPPV